MSSNRKKQMKTQMEKITLSAEQETLLITLLAKSDVSSPIFFDTIAKDIKSRIQYDFASLKVPYKTVILVGQRTKKMDDEAVEFLSMHPDGVVLHLGCGLDSRFWRVDNGRILWYDLDLPAVIELRKKFFEPHDRYAAIASSVTDLSWIDQVRAEGRAVLVIAEGLLMYLKEADVRALFLSLQSAFPGCRIIADAFSTLAAKSAARHASLKKTGAGIHWGIDDPAVIENWAPGIQLIEEWYFSQDPSIKNLGFGYRFAYQLAGLFQAANRAHRILYYQL